MIDYLGYKRPEDTIVLDGGGRRTLARILTSRTTLDLVTAHTVTPLLTSAWTFFLDLYQSELYLLLPQCGVTRSKAGLQVGRAHKRERVISH